MEFMTKMKWAIVITTAVWLGFQVSPVFTTSQSIILLLMLTTSVLMIWMVVRILKDPYTSNKAFEKQFYEDFNYERNDKKHPY
jgi:hypothetical protein